MPAFSYGAGHPHNSTSRVLFCFSRNLAIDFIYFLCWDDDCSFQPPCPPPVINLQALLQWIMADAIQLAYCELPPLSIAAVNAPSSLHASVQPSSSS